MGHCCEKQNLILDAIQYYEDLLEKCENTVKDDIFFRTKLRLGICYDILQKYPESKELYKEIISIDPY